MNRFKEITIIVYFPIFCLAYDWGPIGPKDVLVNDYLSSMHGDVLCVSDGIFIYDWQENNWVKYSNASMPAVQAIDYDTSGVIVILSDSSWSDGIYKFNFKKKQFEVLKYAAFPRFLIYSYTNKTYYCGYGYGLIKSKDGIEWKDIEYFKGKDCLSMTTRGKRLIVSEKNNIHYSSDDGDNWYPCENAPNDVCDLTWDFENNLYAIFPGRSKSSGLWSSADSGKSWSVEFWSQFMSSVYYTYGHLFVGWEKYFNDYGGSAIWDKNKEELVFINDGLPKTRINRFTENTLIDCYNVVVCTDSGAYMTYNFPIGIEEPNPMPQQFILRQNFPNPFNSNTVISYTVGANHDSPLQVDLIIYNQLGQKVATLVSERQPAGNYGLTWNAKNFASGIYYYRLNVDIGFSQTKKLILLR